MLLKRLARAAYSTSGSNSGYKDINFSFSCLPNLLSRCAFVSGGVGRIDKLAKDYGSGSGFSDHRAVTAAGFAGIHRERRGKLPGYRC